MYRSTQHSVTGMSPAELVNKRKMRSKLPQLEDQVFDEEVRDRDRARKEEGKEYADRRRNARESEVRVGDPVLIRQPPTDKLSAPFRSEPFQVVEKTGNSIVVQSPAGVSYRRNSTFVKKFESDVQEVPQPEGIGRDTQADDPPSEPAEPRPSRIRQPPIKLNDYEC